MTPTTELLYRLASIESRLAAIETRLAAIEAQPPRWPVASVPQWRPNTTPWAPPLPVTC